MKKTCSFNVIVWPATGGVYLKCLRRLIDFNRDGGNVGIYIFYKEPSSRPNS